MSSDVQILMGLIFFAGLYTLLVGNYAVSIIPNRCPHLEAKYEQYMAKVEETVEIPAFAEGDITSKEHFEAETGINVTAGSEPVEGEPWYATARRWLEGTREFLDNLPIIGDIRDFSKSIEEISAKASRTVERMAQPIIDFVAQVTFSLSLLADPCVGVTSITMIILAPLMIGIMYLLAKLARGGG